MCVRHLHVFAAPALRLCVREAEVSQAVVAAAVRRPVQSLIRYKRCKITEFTENCCKIHELQARRPTVPPFHRPRPPLTSTVRPAGLKAGGGDAVPCLWCVGEMEDAAAPLLHTPHRTVLQRCDNVTDRQTTRPVCCRALSDTRSGVTAQYNRPEPEISGH